MSRPRPLTLRISHDQSRPSDWPDREENPVIDLSSPDAIGSRAPIRDIDDRCLPSSQKSAYAPPATRPRRKVRARLRHGLFGPLADQLALSSALRLTSSSSAMRNASSSACEALRRGSQTV